jgi:hypothetical protein
LTTFALRCVWPIVDETFRRSELIAAAEELLPAYAAEAGAIITGQASDWDIHDAADEPGWEAYPGTVLVAMVPARPDPARRRQLLQIAAARAAATAEKNRDRDLVDDAIRQLNALGKSDAAIAAEIGGLSRATVSRARDRLGLPANFAPVGRPRAADQADAA